MGVHEPHTVVVIFKLGCCCRATSPAKFSVNQIHLLFDVNWTRICFYFFLTIQCRPPEVGVVSLIFIRSLYTYKYIIYYNLEIPHSLVTASAS